MKIKLTPIRSLKKRPKSMALKKAVSILIDVPCYQNHTEKEIEQALRKGVMLQDNDYFYIKAKSAKRKVMI